MRKMKAMQDLHAQLPKIDCGSCGAPNCRAFAEDVTKGLACIEHCPIKAVRDKKRGGEKDDR